MIQEEALCREETVFKEGVVFRKVAVFGEEAALKESLYSQKRNRVFLRIVDFQE